MGMKRLKLQAIPWWCLHLLGNRMSCLHIRPEPPLRKKIKLINSEGHVKIYDRPVHVSDLMEEFPKHMVCRTDSLYIGQKIPALSKDDLLQLGHNYFLLPLQFCHTVLSFVNVAAFASSRSRNNNALVKKAASCQPFQIQKSSSGCLQIRVSEEFVWQLMEQGKENNFDDQDSNSNSWKNNSRVCTTPQLQKQYTQLVGSRHHWKPKLETIKEKKEKRKISPFGIKRKKKKIKNNNINNNNNSVKSSQKSSELLQVHVTCAKPPSKPKIKIIKSSRKL